MYRKQIFIMKEIYVIALFMTNGELQETGVEYNTYAEALEELKKQPKGKYQIQKLFVVE